jgi:hypothetical protein
MDRPIEWTAYWLDDAWSKPGKSHAFVRGWTGSSGYRALCGGWTGSSGYRALCGYEPAWNANTMYSYEPRCKRCEAKAKKISDYEPLD